MMKASSAESQKLLSDLNTTLAAKSHENQALVPALSLSLKPTALSFSHIHICIYISWIGAIRGKWSASRPTVAPFLITKTSLKTLGTLGFRLISSKRA